MRHYDHREYLERLFYFNTVTRISIYPRPVQRIGQDARAVDREFLSVGLCRCFDCSREVDILSSYLESRRPCSARVGAVWAADVASLAREMSQTCGRGADGLLA